MPEQRQVGERVAFDRGYPAHMMAIDGTWGRPCRLMDVSETGAKMTVEGSILGHPLKESAAFVDGPCLSWLRTGLG
jgi:hypothetical protein